MLEWIVSSSALIAVVVLLRFILKGKILLRLQYALWLLVLVRLLVPVSFGGSAMSLENLTRKAADTQPVRFVSKLSETELPRMSYQAAYNEVAREYADRGIQIDDLPPEQYAEAIDYEIMDKMSSDLSIAELLRIVWLCGTALAGVWFAISNLRLAHSLKKSRTLLTSDHKLPVYLSDAMDTPCLFGLFRPAIYLTGEAAQSDRTMHHAVEHELTHYRHRDNLWAILRGVCLTIHWYNPLVWYAAVLSRNDAELACDEATILRLGEGERASYGRTLIHLTIAKRPILLNTATTMTNSAKSIKERITLIAKKPRMAAYSLAAVILIAVFAVGCTFTGASVPSVTPDEPDNSRSAGQYASIEEYIVRQVEGKTTMTLNIELSDKPVEASILDKELEFLEQYGALEGLDPNGTLEAWGYDWLFKPDPADIDPGSIALAGGMYVDEDGYVCLSQSQIVVALRYPDGSYDILGEEPHGDGFDFFGYHNNIEECIYDWYVKENNLDLPLYVEEWIDRIAIPKNNRPSNFPVHRYDGDGWSIYIPVTAWTPADGIQTQPGKLWVWSSEYGTGSALRIDRFTTSLEDQYIVAQAQGYIPLDETNQVWQNRSEGTTSYYYFTEAPQGGFWRVMIQWLDANITDYLYIAIEPEVLRLMAESFTMDQHSPAQQPVHTGGESEGAADFFSESWVREKRATPEETVTAVLEREADKAFVRSISVDDVQPDEELTKVNIQSLKGSDRAQKLGFSDVYLEKNYAVVRAQYTVEYDQTTVLPVGSGTYRTVIELTRDEGTGLWSVLDNLTPFLVTETAAD